MAAPLQVPKGHAGRANPGAQRPSGRRRESEKRRRASEKSGKKSSIFDLKNLRKMIAAKKQTAFIEVDGFADSFLKSLKKKHSTSKAKSSGGGNGNTDRSGAADNSKDPDCTESRCRQHFEKFSERLMLDLASFSTYLSERAAALRGKRAAQILSDRLFRQSRTHEQLSAKPILSENEKKRQNYYYKYYFQEKTNF